MPRAKRDVKWEPVTVHISPDAAHRLRFEAFRKGVPPGQVLDVLIMLGLPPGPDSPRLNPQRVNVMKATPNPPVTKAPVGNTIGSPPLKRTAGAEVAKAPLEVWTFQYLASVMEQYGISQSDLARGIGIRPRAISDWFERGKIPPARQEEVQKAIARIRASRKP